MKKYSLLIVGALIGGLLAGWYAQHNQISDSHTYQALFASMVNPPDTLASPRTYNQTLVETTDPTAFAALAGTNGVNDISGIRYDILPDSFHIQATVAVNGEITDAVRLALQTTLTDYLSERSDTLTRSLFYPETSLRPIVVFTKELPIQTNIGGNPVVAMLYGLIAGALFGWFIRLGTKKSA